MRWYRDAFCELEQAEAGAPRRRPVRRHGGGGRRGPARLRRGPRDLLERDGRQALGPGRRHRSSASTSTGPAQPNRSACIRALEEQAAYAPRGHLRIIAELDRPDLRRDRVHRRRGQGPAVAADRGRRPRRVRARPGGQGIDRPRRGHVRRPRRRDLRHPGRGRRASSSGSSGPSSPSPPRADAYDEQYARWRELYPRILGLSEAGLLRPMWWPAGPATSTVVPPERTRTRCLKPDSSETKQFHEDVPQRNDVFFLKGSGAYDWGMQQRLARIFRPESGRTVMLAIDHGYFQGPTTGLERVDLNIVPLVPYADALMLTRGHPADGRPADDPAGLRPARQRRPEHPQGAVERAARARRRRRRPAGSRGDGRPGLRRRRVRDPVGPQPDPARRRGLPRTASRSSG